ncbi:MAG: phenylacetate--CoA ligase family protein [Lentilitoribacter sp.]
MQSDHDFVILLEEKTARFRPMRLFKGIITANILYPLAEKLENRNVLAKKREIQRYFRLNKSTRKKIIHTNLMRVVRAANERVPYYRDLFAKINFDLDKLQLDPKYLQDIPILTKDIILDQGARMLSSPLESQKFHDCKTGGSTGKSCHIYYDQEAADYSSAVTLYCRTRVGNSAHESEVHFACNLPDSGTSSKMGKDDYKSIVMNRSNIFFDQLDNASLGNIWQKLVRRKPFMAHAHPSTMYALACYIQERYDSQKAFEVFESSGELLEPYMRQAISSALNCQVVDRYGLAEFGVIGYEFHGPEVGMQLLDSEGWAESVPMDGEDIHQQFVFTGFRNSLMPLIRYQTGDIAKVEERENGFFMTNVTGRIHDMIEINGIQHATHYIQDILDHRVGGIQEFQIDTRFNKPLLRILPAMGSSKDDLANKIRYYWKDAFDIEFVGNDGLIKVGERAKFRHVVT